MQMRIGVEQRLAQCGERVVGQLLAQHVGQRPQNGPVLARVARRERGARRHLHAAFGVDVSCPIFPGRPRPAAPRRRAWRHGRRGCRYRRRRRRARYRSRRRRAGTERRACPTPPSAARSGRPRPGTKPRSSAPTREAALCSTLKPFQPSFTAPRSTAALAASDAIAAPSSRANAAAPTSTSGRSALRSVSAKLCRAMIGERFRAGAEIIVSCR